MTPKTTKEILNVMRERCAAATAGPWNYEEERYSAKCIIGVNPTDDRWIAHFQPEFNFNGEANGRFACAAREDLPLLLEAMEAGIKALERECCRCERPYKCPPCEALAAIDRILSGEK